MAGAPEGNHNAAKGREWRDALRYELARIGRDVDGDEPAYRKGLRKCAEGFIIAACAGEAWALKELGDREDGRAIQSLDITGNVSTDVSGLEAFYGLLPAAEAKDDSG